MDGATAYAREWVLGLPAGTWFNISAVPAPRQITSNLLHRMLKAEQPVIGKLARGLYWRQPHPLSQLYGQPPISGSSCLSVATPPGSGYADWNALYALGWSTQGPVNTIVATPNSGLAPPAMPAHGDRWTYLHRGNQRRKELNWNEATLIEGALAFGGANLRDWRRVVGRLKNRETRLKPHTLIHMDRVIWAAKTEKPLSKWPGGEGDKSFGSVVERLASDLPNLVNV